MVELTQTQLRQLQMIELEMLVEVDRICKNNNIKYTIIGGTLLGAVRHGGFIPWDDDADIAMLRPEYEKFCKIVNDELDSERFYFQNMDITPGYRWGYAKMRRKNTLFLRENQEHMPYEQGVFLDIFPIDGTPNNMILRMVHEFRCYIVRKALWSEVALLTATLPHEVFFYRMLNRIPLNKLKKMYRKLILKENINTKVVRTLTFPAPKPLHGYLRKWFEETQPIEFEGHMFEGIKDYKGWLKYEFGDYMTIPPLDKQKVHPVSKVELLDVDLGGK